MADAEQVVHLSGSEEIHAVRAQIARAQAPRVILVVPRAHPAFSNLVRMRMLSRQASEVGKQLAIVSKDYRIRELAEGALLADFGSVEAARRARRWRRGAAPQGAPAVSHVRGGAGGAALTVARGRGAVLRRKDEIGMHTNWGEHVMLAGLLFGMLIILSAVLVLLVPSAQVTLVPRQLPLESTFAVTVDPTVQNVNRSEGIVPGARASVFVQRTLEAATSGRTDVPASRASGRVLFVNVTGQAVTVPVGTIVSTSSAGSVRFRTLEPAAVPGEIGARASAAIEALASGPTGNVGPLQINIVEGAAATVVRVLNEQPTEGGDVAQVAVVTAADKEALLDQLEQRLLQEGRAALERALEVEPESLLGFVPNEEYVLLPETLRMDKLAETYNGSVGDQAESLSLDLRVEVSALLVSIDDVDRVARRRIEGEVPQGYRELQEGFELAIGEAQVGDDGLARVAVSARAVAGAELSGEEIRALVRGQPVEEAEAILLQRLPLAASPVITVSPDWWGRMPYLPPRIFIRVGVLGVAPEPVTP